MKTRSNHPYRLSLAVASVVLLSTGPGLAQSATVPCSAFTRNDAGEWKVLAPVMLHIDGRLLGPIVGSTFEAGTMTNGIDLSEVLDRACPSFPVEPARLR